MFSPNAHLVVIPNNFRDYSHLTHVSNKARDVCKTEVVYVKRGMSQGFYPVRPKGNIKKESIGRRPSPTLFFFGGEEA